MSKMLYINAITCHMSFNSEAKLGTSRAFSIHLLRPSWPQSARNAFGKLCLRKSVSTSQWQAKAPAAECWCNMTTLPLTLMSDFVHHVHHNIDLAHGGAVEVFPYGQCELFLRNAPLVLLPGHSGRLSANAGLREESLIQGRGESGGYGEVVGDAVGI